MSPGAPGWCATGTGTADVLAADGALVAILPALALLIPEVSHMRRKQ